jgi:hypothetical protein
MEMIVGKHVVSQTQPNDARRFYSLAGGLHYVAASLHGTHDAAFGAHDKFGRVDAQHGQVAAWTRALGVPATFHGLPRFGGPAQGQFHSGQHWNHAIATDQSALISFPGRLDTVQRLRSDGVFCGLKRCHNRRFDVRAKHLFGLVVRIPGSKGGSIFVQSGSKRGLVLVSTCTCCQTVPIGTLHSVVCCCCCCCVVKAWLWSIHAVRCRYCGAVWRCARHNLESWSLFHICLVPRSRIVRGSRPSLRALIVEKSW